MAHDDHTEQDQGRQREMLFAELANAVVAGGGDRLVPRLCRSFVDLLEADGGAITLANTQVEQATLCATGDVADRIEDLQEVLGEGPAPDAYTTGAMVVGDLEGDGGQRWPLFTGAARAIGGPLTLYAFPMRSSSTVLGVITVHVRSGGPPRRDLDQAAFFADAIGAAILQQAHVDREAPPWHSRDRVNQATGMVVAQLGIGPQDALALMRAFAFSHTIPMNDLATDIIEHRQNFADNADAREDDPREDDPREGE